MTRWFLSLLAVVTALSGAPVAALDIGERIGPVLMNPGGTICDTAEDVVMAIRALDGEQVPYPASCGWLMTPLPVVMEVVDHHKTSKNTYAILRVRFISISGLGVQYGWMVDPGKEEGAST